MTMPLVYLKESENTLTPQQIDRAIAKQFRIGYYAYSRSAGAMLKLITALKGRYWCELKINFDPSDQYPCWAGFTPALTTGWNGVPDYYAHASTLPMAVALAALAIETIEVGEGE